MRWLSRKVAVEVRYVPIPAFGHYGELWGKDSYLADVANAADSQPWLVEHTELVRQMREAADAAETPQELKAYNRCISLAKRTLVLSAIARQAIADRKTIAEMSEGD